MVYEGDLILVNKDHFINEKRNLNLVNLDETDKGGLFTVHEEGMSLEKNTLENFKKMLTQAKNQGVIGIEILSSYRTLEEQQNTYNEILEEYKKMGYSQSNALLKTKGRVAPVGGSEHHTGMSLDMGLSNQLNYGKSSQAKWFTEHMYEFGFIERYKDEKKEITGVMYEPWHIRYVGLPHSKIIKQNNWCYEEYIEYLQENRIIECELEGINYKVEYKPRAEYWILDKNEDPIMSGDNIGGIIITKEVE